ncbi:MAG: GAF domain-containing protein, partial [Halothece sp. Uz-M2-17]|nr:GAF domain-containing protein [Halothece sp. Uz-M2-17]
MYTEETPSNTPEVIKANPATPDSAQNFDASSDLKHFQNSLQSLKQELSRVRGLERTEILNKLQQIESIGQHFEQWISEPSIGNGNAGNGANTYSSTQREKLLQLGQQIQECRDLSSLLNLACRETLQISQAQRCFVYQFDGEEQGKVLAESVERGWTPAKGEMLPATMFGRDEAREYLQSAIAVINGTDRATPYQQQLLDRYQVQSSLALTLRIDGKPWGLLVVHSCQSSDPWAEDIINVLYQMSTELALKLASFDYQELVKQEKNREQTKVAIISRIRQSEDLDTIFETATQEIRRALRCDRVGIYRFNEDWSGGFVAEAVTTGWTPVINSDDPAGDVKNDCSLRMLGGERRARDSEDTYLQDTKGGGYAKGKKYSVVNDIYEMGFPRCYLNQLEKYECRAYINVPIFQGEKLWGLMAAYQNSGPRQWTDEEKDLLVEVSEPLGVALNQAEYIQELQKQTQREAAQAEQEKTKANIISRIRQSQDLDQIFQVTTKDVRKVVNADRAVVYQFNEDWSGQVVAESVTGGWVSLLIEQTNDEVLSGDRTSNDRCTLRKWSSGDITDRDTYLQDNQGGKYKDGKRYTAIDDIYEANFPACYIQSLEKYQARAYIIVPIFQGDNIWGLLGIYQNDGPRQWQQNEIDLLVQVGDQLAVALQQAEFVEQLKQKNEQLAQGVEREKTTSKIVDRIRRTQEVNAVFENTTQEMLNILKAERVALYKFYEDWSGEFVAESVASGWKRLVGTEEAKVKDTYLKDNEGGRYALGQNHVVPDIYQEGFDPCHVELLETFQCRAYILVPVFQDDTLWGILGVYQNGSPRQWQESEVQLTRQVATQFG